MVWSALSLANTIFILGSKWLQRFDIPDIFTNTIPDIDSIDTYAIRSRDRRLHSYWWSRMLPPFGDFDPHRRQRCSFHARDSTVGDRAFPVAAARTWNNSTTQSHFSALDCLHAYVCIILQASHLCLFSVLIACAAHHIVPVSCSCS